MKILFSLKFIVISLIPIFMAHAENDEDGVVLFPKLEETELRKDRILRDYCTELLKNMHDETVGLSVGKVFLYEGRPVLLTDGDYLKGGRVSNFWDWREIGVDGFGPVKSGYDNEGKFAPLGDDSYLHVDLTNATYMIQDGYYKSLPAIYDVGGEKVILVRAYKSGDGRFLHAIYSRISADGRLQDVVETAVAVRKFQKTWHRLGGFRLSVRN